MSLNHKDRIQIRNPWWCGGPMPQSSSTQDGFWTYKWLVDFFSTTIEMGKIFFHLQVERKVLPYNLI
jgi:hypothetical protein